MNGKWRIIAGRYAKSLIELALEGNDLNGLFADMIAIEEVCESVPSFLKALSDERIDLKTRRSGVKRIARALSLRAITEKAIQLLIVKNRIEILPRIAHAVIHELRFRKRLAVAQVQVADEALVDDVQRGVQQALSKSLGLKVECEMHVEPELLGGFVAEIGDRRFDSSVRGKLTTMKEEFFSDAHGH